jgi:hypothetical protein
MSGVFYTPSAVARTLRLHEPAAGTGGFLLDAATLLNPPFATVPTTTHGLNLPALLAQRSTVPDAAILNCLDLASWLEQQPTVKAPARISTAGLRERWHCSQPAVSRRMAALLRHGLIGAQLVGGRGAFWLIWRVGVAQ